MSLPTNYNDGNLEPLRAVVIERLKQGFAEGQLEIEELERRLAQASEVGTASDLGRLISDLPAEPQQAASDRRSAEFAGRQKRSVVTLLGGTSRAGRWQPAPILATYTFMGGTELDFRDAVFPPEGVTVRIFCFMGGVEITVPPHITVDVDGFALMGAFEDKSRNPAPSAKAQLTVRGFCMMGGVEVRTRPARGRDE
jgi:hypothetical protein